jgi:prepilin-type N-terminal cleavage/methylation domain-containing protein
MYLRGKAHHLNPSFRATRHAPRATRPGFTLIEMLVAMALTMFLIVILSEAFATGLDSFTQLKAIGDMEGALRAPASVIRADLAADHFEGKRRLSDSDIYANRPREGFFVIYRPNPPNIPEGVDGYGLPSLRSTVYVMHMTVKKRGNQRGDTFSAFVPAASPLLTVATNFFGQPIDARVQDNANTYNSQWAEVAYFLVCTGTNMDFGTPPDLTQPLPAGVVPLYSLYRVERLVTPDNRLINAAAIPDNAATEAAYAQLSWRGVGGNLYFNNPTDLVTPVNRSFYFGAPGNPLVVPVNYTFNSTDSAGRGAALLATNVVSFHVRVLRGTSPGFHQPVRQYPDGDFVDTTFDSSSDTMNSGGATVYITGVAVSLRLWDQKTQQARQITVVQDM